MRILASQINPTIGDFAGNTDKIIKSIALAKKQGADLVLFSELCLTGYPPEDFLLLPHFIDAAEKHLQKIVKETQGICVVLGTVRHNPSKTEKQLFNTAAVISDGSLIGFQDKMLLPTYDVFDERRYFEPGHETRLWNLCGKKIGITICEDIWQHSSLVKHTSYSDDPIIELKKLHPELLLNLSSSPYSFNKTKTRLDVCAKAANALSCPMILCNQVGGSDSLIFDGYSFYVGADAQLLQVAKGFEEDWMLVDLALKSSKAAFNIDVVKDLYQALVLGVRDYFQKQGFKTACLGLSGGIDSALVACIAVDALGKDNVLGVGMPSKFSSEGSIHDAVALAKNLGIDYQQIPIEGPFTSYLELLQPFFKGKAPDVTEENLQARIRGMILMALSNKLGHIVLSTGNKSELALGYSTLYGDLCGGLGVINDVTKEQVYLLSNWINRDQEIIPKNTITKPPSAELRPNQKDSDSLPNYEIVDNVLKDYVEELLSPQDIAKKHGYSLDLVMDLVKKIHRSEYKRRQSPPGLRVSEKAFSVGRHFPIVQKWI